MKLIIRWLVSASAVMLGAYLIPGVQVEDFKVALLVSIVLGFLNLIIRPILVVLTLPINILTLGLFTLVINAVLVLWAAKIVSGFHVGGFVAAVLFSVVLSLVHAILHHVEKKEN